MDNDKPLSSEELRKLRPSMRNMYILQKEHLTGTKRFANWVTEKVGTMGFFYILIIATVLWTLWNLFAPLEMRFDSGPDFFFYVLITNLLSLFLLPIIMVGQNLQEQKADARADADFELNKIEEKEIDTILRHLEIQNELILKILSRVEGEMKEDIRIDTEIKKEITNV